MLPNKLFFKTFILIIMVRKKAILMSEFAKIQVFTILRAKNISNQLTAIQE